MKKQLNLFWVVLPVRRPFNLRVYFIFVALYFLGNLAGIPLLRATNNPIEPVWFWGVATLIFAVIMGLGMAMANRTGLGAPLLEGRLARVSFPPWLRTGLALTVLVTAATMPFSLWLNLEVEPAVYPAGYQLILASIKAGIVEELGYRYFTVSLLTLLGGHFSREADGRPTNGVYWTAILITGLIFGWAHVDARLGVPGAPFSALAGIMLLSTLLGIAFGWLFWRLGIEWAIVAHFTYDAVVSAGLLKVYLSGSNVVWAVFLALSILLAYIAWQAIKPTYLKNHLANF